MNLTLNGGTLIDGTGQAPIEDVRILIEGNRIKGVERSAATTTPELVQTIDTTAKFILPGLVNSHDHLEDRRTFGPWNERMARPKEMLLLCGVRGALVSLQEGITTVRDTGGLNSLYLKQALELGLIAGPRMKTCILPISQTGGHGVPLCIEADSPEETRKAARALLFQGADFIKCMASGGAAQATRTYRPKPQMSVREMSAAFEEAHKAGRPTTVHAHLPEAIRDAIEAGVDTIEHGAFMDRPTADLMAEKGIFLVSSLSEIQVTGQDGVSWRRPAIQAQRAAAICDVVLANFRNAVQAGVKIATGTDVLGQVVLEMKLMVECGMSPMDVIVATTLRGAELLRMEDQIGTVEPGKLADLIVLRRNPLESVEAFSDIELVVKDGQTVRPAAMNPLIGEQLRGYLVDHGRLLAPHEFPV